MKLIRKNNKKGFTLVELIVVIAIIAILALILIPAITGYTKKADEAALQSSARALHTKAVMHVSEKGFDKDELKTVLTNELGDKFTITDPVTNKKDGKFSFTVSFKNTNKSGSVEVNENGIVVPEVSTGT